MGLTVIRDASFFNVSKTGTEEGESAGKNRMKGTKKARKRVTIQR
jgi:hypothetical protein